LNSYVVQLLEIRSKSNRIMRLRKNALCLMSAASESDGALAQRNSVCDKVWRVGHCKRQVDWGTVAV